MQRRSARPLAWGVGLYVLLFVAMYAMIRADLVAMDPCFSTEGLGDLCYCERFHDGLVKQPANTWTNLAFGLVGFAVLGDVAWSAPRPDNRFTRDTFYPAWYGLLALYLGPASMVFHASYTYWAGILDGAAMYVWLSFVLVYNLVRLFDWSRATAFAVWAAVNALWLTLRITIPNQGSAVSSSTLLFVALLCAMMASMAAVLLRGRVRTSASGAAWLFASIFAFAGGLLVWLQSGTGGPWCRPDSPLQGHAAWHVAAAAAVAALYVHLRGSVDAAGASEVAASVSPDAKRRNA